MGRFNGGWIKIHRGILDHPVSHRGMFTFAVFIRLLYMANWKPSSAIFGGKKITVLPGQLITGLRELSPDKDEDPYLNKVRASLEYLVLCEAIEQVSNNQGRLITICNWAKYQSAESEALSISTSEEQEAHKQSTSKPQLSEESKKERREEYTAWFEKILSEYKKLPGVKKGPKAEDRFREQIKTEEDLNKLSLAVKNYSEFLSRPENSWRKPKTTFDTFLGSKSSGYFWRDFISSDTQATSPLGTLSDLNVGHSHAS